MPTEDIHVYSIDEVFIDLTSYLAYSGLTVREFAKRMIHDVLENTGITATAGIGTNLYLAKIAMGIVDSSLLVRRVNIAANHGIPESAVTKQDVIEQLDLFTDYEAF